MRNKLVLAITAMILNSTKIFLKITGIRWKLIIVMVTLTSIAIAVTGSLILRKEKDAILAKTIEVCDTTAMGLGNVAQDALLTQIHAPIQEYITRLMSVGLTGLQYVYVVNNDRVVVAHSDPGRIGSTIQDSGEDLNLKTASGHVIHSAVHRGRDGRQLDCLEFSYPIGLVHRGKEFFVGFSKIGFSKETIYSSVVEVSRTVATVSIIVLVSSIIIVACLAHMIVKPIKIISQQSRLVAKGNLDVRIKAKSRDELGELASDFNKMTDSLLLARKELVEKTRMEHELETARLVQSTLFPEKDFQNKWLELSGFYQSSAETGGDWFGYLADGDGKEVNVFIGDVTGHGAAAAIVTASVNSLFSFLNANHKLFDIVRNISSLPDLPETLSAYLTDGYRDMLAPGTVLKNLNNMLYKLSVDVTCGMNMTAVSSRIVDGQYMVYANAGHNFPIIARASGNIEGLFASRNLRLGDAKDAAFPEATAALRAGDVILWYTDGLVECENKEGEAYGKRRLRECLFKNARLGLDAKAIKMRLMEDALDFFANTPLKDDITFVVGRIK